MGAIKNVAYIIVTTNLNVEQYYTEPEEGGEPYFGSEIKDAKHFASENEAMATIDTDKHKIFRNRSTIRYTMQYSGMVKVEKFIVIDNPRLP